MFFVVPENENAMLETGECGLWRVHASVSRGSGVSIEIAMPIEVLRLLQEK